MAPEKKRMEQTTTTTWGWLSFLERARHIGIAGTYIHSNLSPRFVTSITGTSVVRAAKLAVGAKQGQRRSQGLLTVDTITHHYILGQQIINFLKMNLGSGHNDCLFSEKNCDYKCTDVEGWGGGCEVSYFGAPDSTVISHPSCMTRIMFGASRIHTYRIFQGYCYPESSPFGGSCKGTPSKCQDCNQVVKC